MQELEGKENKTKQKEKKMSLVVGSSPRVTNSFSAVSVAGSPTIYFCLLQLFRCNAMLFGLIAQTQFIILAFAGCLRIKLSSPRTTQH